MNARGKVASLFRSGLGLVFLAAFLSLAVQLKDLAGSRGLLPWVDYLQHLGPAAGSSPRVAFAVPTLFLWIHGDAAFTLVPILGAALSLLLLFGLGGRAVVAALWLLYLSCITAGRDFFFYQWDNL